MTRSNGSRSMSLVEHHEVVDEDLVHPAQRPERVEVVLARLALDVARLAGEVGRCGVDRLTTRGEDPGHGVLGEPLDVEVGVEGSRLVGDGEVSSRVTESDRRGDVERLLATRGGPDMGAPTVHGASRGRRAGSGTGAHGIPVETLREAPDLVVDQNGVARERAVAGALDDDEPRHR